MINRKSVLSHAIDNGFDQTITGYPVTLKYAQEKNVIDYTIEGNTVNANSSLPKAYRQLEYIESMGKVRLYTDVRVNDCKGYEVEFQSTGIAKVANSNLDGIFGANNTGADSKIWFGYDSNRTVAYNNMTLLGAPGCSTPRIDINEYYKTKHTIKIAVDGTVTYDGEMIAQLTGFKEATKNVFLVYCGQEGFCSKTRIFSSKLYGESSKIIRDYIPCYRISDGFAGLYDKVTKTFITNDSTAGLFLKGPEITKGVGDLDSESGKYIIPITVQGKNTLTINALLDTPLNSGETVNYNLDNLPTLSLSKDTNIIKCNTTVPPANISVTYKTKVRGPYE